MPTLKQKTVSGKTYELKRYRTDRPGKQYEYYVTEDGSRVGDPVYTRNDGMEEFRGTVQAVQRGEGEERSQGRGPSLPGMGGGGGGGGPRLPGMGGAGFGADEEDDDDDDLRLPFL